MAFGKDIQELFNTVRKTWQGLSQEPQVKFKLGNTSQFLFLDVIEKTQKRNLQHSVLMSSITGYCLRKGILTNHKLLTLLRMNI